MLARLLALLVLLAALAPASAGGSRTLLTSNGGAGTLGAFDLSPDGTPTPFAGGPVASGDGASGIVVSPDARFAFVTNTQDDTVRPFAIGADRTLAPVSAALSTGGNAPTALAITPDGRRLLVAHRTGQDVSVFDVDPATGSLTPAALAQNVGFEDAGAIAVSRNGAFVYVAGRGPEGPPASNADTRLGFLTLNANGTLTPVGGSPLQFAGVIGGFGLSVTPDGARLYLSFVTAAKIGVFTLNAGTGVPTPVAGSPFAAGANVQQGMVTPDGTRLYALDVFGTSVPGYDLTPATGAPAAIAGSPFSVGAGNQPQGIAMTPDGRALYASIGKNPSIFAGFSVGASGALTALAGSPFASTGSFSSFYSAAVTPTQSPAGSIAVTAGEPGKPSAFSTDATARGGFITRYDWDFGDGGTLADGGATATHTYGAPGTYTAKLTLTNDCDPDAVFRDGSVFNGRTTSCNGARVVTIERAVTVPAPAPAPAPVMNPPAAKPAAFTATRAFTLPSAARCLKRPPRLTLAARRPAGVTIERVEVRVAGRRVVRRTGAAARRSITLRRLPARTFTLTLSVKPRGGKTATTRRTYKVCKATGR